jgi:glycosyltransferase involved in cell wall biosynthesis
MRILWFSHRDIKYPSSGGAEKTIYEVGRRLVLKGNEMKWFSVAADSLPVAETISGIDIVRLPSNILAHVYAPIILRKEKYDVVVDDMAHAVPWGSENFSHSKGTVFFRHLHRRSLKGQVSMPKAFLLSGIEALYPFLYRRWPFVTESESSIQDLENLGIEKRRIAKIYPGLGENDFLTFDKTETPSLVYFGGMRDYKRPWEPLYVLKELINAYQDIHLFMVGSGLSLQNVKEICQNTGLSRYVTFTGRLSDEELKQLVGRSWVNIHSSVTEGFGLSIVEASALGTPTVAYDVPGVNETVEDGKNGALVEEGNRKMMAESIMRIIGQYSDWWVKSSIDAARKYSWEKTARAWDKHLQTIV